MLLPDFKTFEDVYKFLDYGGEEWCRPMVESYLDMIGDTPLEEIDIEELNGWIEHEMGSLSEGYEEYYE
tara:strand:- start:244 stop:450 length:207 start_codon:yes stop_codon:yes gene_type:complete